MDGRGIELKGRVVIAGGTGFIGHAVVQEFSAAGYEIVVLSRSDRPVAGAKIVLWDAKTPGTWAEQLDGAEAVINLVGENVFTHWTTEKKARMMASRVGSTKVIGQAIEGCNKPPAVWVNASAVGYYGDTGERIVDETSPGGNDFLAEICRNWEAAQAEFDCPATKRSIVRIGFVLGRNGGAFPVLRKLTKWFLGSATGSGRQWVPWIHIEDLAAIFRTCVEQRLEGAINGVGPEAVRNRDLMAALRRAMHRPWAPNVPKPILALGSLFALPPTEVTLASQRALSGRLPEIGFQYRFPTLAEAVDDLLKDRP